MKVRAPTPTKTIASKLISSNLRVVIFIFGLVFVYSCLVDEESSKVGVSSSGPDSSCCRSSADQANGDAFSSVEEESARCPGSLRLAVAGPTDHETTTVCVDKMADTTRLEVPHLGIDEISTTSGDNQRS